MIHIYSLFILCSIALGSTQYKVELEGLNRTDHEWFIDYLELPESLDQIDINNLKKEILNMQVIDFVEVIKKDQKLYIKVNEKWTTIPVIRGVYGGGTPLTVLGAYDIHSFGRLITLGIERRRYGNADPGYVGFVKAPKLFGGRSEFAFEYWDMNRIREVYSEGKNTGYFESSYQDIKVQYLAAVTQRYRIGISSQYLRIKKTRIEDVVPVERLAGKSTFRSALLYQVFDDIKVDRIIYDGIRARLEAGPVFSDKDLTRINAEFFYYKRLGLFNPAAHIFVGQINSDILELGYFLGGFDSVRGIPDGYVNGSKYAYTNLEIRHISLQTRSIWLQTVGFFDIGTSGQSWDNSQTLSSLGGGIRVAVPKIHRLMFRLDVAKSLSHSTYGFSFGMNHFFQPYIPLK